MQEVFTLLKCVGGGGAQNVLPCIKWEGGGRNKFRTRDIPIS